ncbi:MAG: HAD family phosphatase [Candidatus Nealsonbacteria bacterium]|nr:HAD family phosphatase [Candidatus Nealsonbacteria bacterium]
MNKFKLVCFDIDGTLVDGISWLLLTKGLGCSIEKHLDIFNRSKSGEISFFEGERMLTKMYQESGNANQKFIKELFSKIESKPEAKEIVSYLKKKGYKTYLISGAIDIYVEEIAKKLGVDGFYANSSLEFDKNGILEKIYYRDNQGEIKIKQLNELVKKIGINIKEVVFMGDSDNDLEVFKQTGYGIAIGFSSEELKKFAWKKIDSLKEIKDIL